MCNLLYHPSLFCVYFFSIAPLPHTYRCNQRKYSTHAYRRTAQIRVCRRSGFAKCGVIRQNGSAVEKRESDAQRQYARLCHDRTVACYSQYGELERIPYRAERIAIGQIATAQQYGSLATASASRKQFVATCGGAKRQRLTYITKAEIS